MAKLTIKQRKFADYYIELGSGAEAARRAGYSEKTAGAIATENLKKPHVSEYIAERMEELKSKAIADQREVLEYLTSVLRREERETVVVTLMDESVDYRPDENGVVRRYSTKRTIAAPIEVANRVTDANKAAELLGKRYRLFEGNTNQEALERLDTLFTEFKAAVQEETLVTCADERSAEEESDIVAVNKDATDALYGGTDGSDAEASDSSASLDEVFSRR